MKRKGEAIAWVIAYYYPFSHCAEQAGINMILDFIDEDDFSSINNNQNNISVT